MDCNRQFAHKTLHGGLVHLAQTLNRLNHCSGNLNWVRRQLPAETPIRNACHQKCHLILLQPPSFLVRQRETVIRPRGRVGLAQNIFIDVGPSEWSKHGNNRSTKETREMTPEERKNYDPDAKRRCRTKAKQLWLAQQIPTADEWLDQFPIDHPAQASELNQHATKFAGTVLSELEFIPTHIHDDVRVV